MPSSRSAKSTTPSGYTSVRLGDLPAQNASPKSRRTTRTNAQKGSKVRLVILLVCVLVAGCGVGFAVLYNSDVFEITEVTVNGADHLTSEEMSVLAAVPQGSTLLNVDASSIENRVDRDAWVQKVSVKRLFPNTLEINVTERQIAAVVDVVADNAKVTQQWAIASDGMWLMEIPDQNSELGKSISSQIYTDAAQVLHIKDVPYGLTPEVGTYCTDGNVNNALEILDGLSTDLASQVKTVSATDAASTLLTLENGVEIAFGTADDIREKERLCLEIMEKYEGKVAYINVRVPDRPTWRAS
jgi:cell division protein FtsQ